MIIIILIIVMMKQNIFNGESKYRKKTVNMIFKKRTNELMNANIWKKKKRRRKWWSWQEIRERRTLATEKQKTNKQKKIAKETTKKSECQ